MKNIRPPAAVILVEFALSEGKKACMPIAEGMLFIVFRNLPRKMRVIAENNE